MKFNKSDGEILTAEDFNLVSANTFMTGSSGNDFNKISYGFLNGDLDEFNSDSYVQFSPARFNPYHNYIAASTANFSFTNFTGFNWLQDGKMSDPAGGSTSFTQSRCGMFPSSTDVAVFRPDMRVYNLVGYEDATYGFTAASVWTNTAASATIADGSVEYINTSASGTHELLFDMLTATGPLDIYFTLKANVQTPSAASVLTWRIGFNTDLGATSTYLDWSTSLGSAATDMKTLFFSGVVTIWVDTVSEDFMIQVNGHMINAPSTFIDTSSGVFNNDVGIYGGFNKTPIKDTKLGTNTSISTYAYMHPYFTFGITNVTTGRAEWHVPFIGESVATPSSTIQVYGSMDDGSTFDEITENVGSAFKFSHSGTQPKFKVEATMSSPEVIVFNGVDIASPTRNF